MLAKLKALWTKLNGDLSSLWNDSKVFVIIFGVLILALKFKDLIINFLVSSGQTIYNNANQKAEGLNAQENEDNESAQQLIDNANKLSNQESPVSDGWNEKE